jgi:hypothetical protein
MASLGLSKREMAVVVVVVVAIVVDAWNIVPSAKCAPLVYGLVL